MHLKTTKIKNLSLAMLGQASVVFILTFWISFTQASSRKEFLTNDNIVYIYNGKVIDIKRTSLMRRKMLAVYVLKGLDASKLLDIKFEGSDIAMIFVTEGSQDGLAIKSRLDKAGISNDVRLLNKFNAIFAQLREDQMLSEMKETDDNSEGFVFKDDFSEEEFKRLLYVVAGKLIIVNDKEINIEDLKKIPLSQFKSVQFSTDTLLKHKYGTKTDNGIIVIKTKTKN